MYAIDRFASIRNELRGALAAYSAEAAQMQNLLMRSFEQSDEERCAAIQIGQAALDAARTRFEHAKEQYVRDVLDDAVASLPGACS